MAILRARVHFLGSFGNNSQPVTVDRKMFPFETAKIPEIKTGIFGRTEGI